MVDDNADVLAIVSELVSASGYEAITASGGKEAIEKAKSESPDLILLDINMPDIDGWSVLRSLKDDGLTDRIKVMMLTAYTDIGTDIFGLQDVVSGYIRKPFSNTELSDKIKEILETEEVTIQPVKTDEKKPGVMERLFGKTGVLSEHIVSVQLVLLHVPLLLPFREVDAVLLLEHLEILLVLRIYWYVYLSLKGIRRVFPPREEKELELHRSERTPC
ncbi:MAG: response regulator [Methanomassiliicoccales archaeon]|nr:response regulator [Methanomassiliicoccales archaeon]